MFFVYTLLVVFLIPNLAYAWGPGTHLEIALYAIAHAPVVLPVIRKLLAKHPEEFIYGSVSPDIIQGKKYAGYIHHCHNWNVAKVILEEAKSEKERAAAYGYLTHLAADCVAHNYFVPYKMIHSFPNLTLGHIYWEMRFDLRVPDEAWRHLPGVIRHSYNDFDHLLERVLKRTLFSFKTNKNIFNSILILQKMKRMRKMLKRYERASRWALTEDAASHFKKLVFKTVLDFLEHGEKAECFLADPSGMRKLAYAKSMRRRMRRLKNRGKLNQSRSDEIIRTVQKGLLTSLFDPKMALPGLEELL